MAKLTSLALLVSALASGAFSSPAPHSEANHDVIHKRDPQRAQAMTVTVTKTVTSASVSTVTKCSTGTSSSRPQTSTTTGRTTSKTSSTPAAPTSTGEPTYDPGTCTWKVHGAGYFANKKEFTFFEDGLPDGLYASNYVVEDTYAGAPYNHVFEGQNVFSDGDFLNLKVPGVSNPRPNTGYAISSAEIVTTENNILYASVRTNAIFSTVPGTCHGIFFYLDDSQECDIEYLTDPNSQSNNIDTQSSQGAPIPLWYSNQAIKSGTPATQATGPAPYDVTAVHEYRIDWTKDFTAFYLDGQLQKKYTTNIPNKPGSWIWNNWANGDYGWSAGPPTQDNVFMIQNITMYYNTANDSNGCN
ncbi:hypothetical protein PMZ80_005101 [Knufia obscura]|uniref:GH16 domain-containing protein n=1 Tax=Knufia obscura TaxID=1635080 RepID=A0ABR0RPK9_9EURO|nr:hypothetical protein PMZ80_005101 [Knufia obscura]